MSNDILKNRNEIVFLYDVRDANPNGDPDNSNMPRMDDITGENIVTDLRLKRTVRDYWLGKNRKILIRAEEDADGNRKTMDILATEFLGMGKMDKKKSGEARAKLANDLPKEYVDVRNFGAAVTLTHANFSHTGTIQFGLGRSLNKPTIQSRTITSSLASTEDKGQGSIGEYHTVDYSLIRFHGIANEINALVVQYTESDLLDLFKAMWNGTSQLNTRSKFNHMPRLLLNVRSKINESQIGDLDLCVKLQEVDEINTVDEAKLDISSLIERIEKYMFKVDTLQIFHDDSLSIYYMGEKIANLLSFLEEKFADINVEKIKLEEE